MLLALRHPADPAALPRLGIALIVLVAVWPMLRLTEFNPLILFDPGNRAVIGRYLAQFFPPDVSWEFLSVVGVSILQTLAIANVGVFLAVVIALPLSLAATRALSVSRVGPSSSRWLGIVRRAPVRALLAVLRGIPEIVWALLFVRVVGLGPTAGVLAIAVTYSGMLGKVYAEIFESGDARAPTALIEAGSGRVAAFLYGVLPGTYGEIVSYTVYRWECAIRASAVMGFVGAGGLGQQLELSMRMLNGAESCTILLAFLLLVMLADAVSAGLRRVLQ